MKMSFLSRRVLVFVGVIIVAVALAFASSNKAQPSVARAVPLAAPGADCVTVSCTVYLPVIFSSRVSPLVIEVTQGVQQPDNRVMLIENRPTFARVSITSGDAHTNVSAQLYGYRGGVALAGSPVAAMNNPRALKPSVSRDTLGDTFNFELPAVWLNGTIELSVKADNGSSFNYSSAAAQFSFTPAAPMHVTIVPIAYTCNSGGSGTTTPVGPFNYLINDYTFRTYPLSSIPLSAHSAVSYSGPCNGSSVPAPEYADWQNILYAVTDVWQNEGSSNSYYYGLMDIDCGGGCISGLGWVGGYKVAVGFNGIGASHYAASETHGHEVGHNHGRRHAPGCGAANPDGGFPYATDGKGYIGNSTYQNYGFDIVTHDLYSYVDTYDFMSYCGPAWVSDYTYNALWNFDNDYQEPYIRLEAQPALLVAGTIDPASQQVIFQSVEKRVLPVLLPKSGEYVIELLDAAGRVLAAYPFEPVLATADSYRQGTAFEYWGFHLTLPYPEGVASIRVRHGDAVWGVLSDLP